MKEVQSLNGLLNFACSVIVPGRAFLRRLIDLTIGVRSPKCSIRLTRSVKEDLKVWLSFLAQYNRKSLFLPDVWNNSDKLSLYTDAAGAIGFGAIFGNNWCYGSWPDNWIGKNIAILEFYPIVLSLSLWGDQLCNQCVLFFTDNELWSMSLTNNLAVILPLCLSYASWNSSRVLPTSRVVYPAYKPYKLVVYCLIKAAMGCSHSQFDPHGICVLFPSKRSSDNALRHCFR